MEQIDGRDGRTKRFFRILLALIYLLAGIAHIRSPGGFLQITPDWVPYPEQVILWTGIAEIAGAIGLLVPPRVIPRMRHAAGIGLALYALCVYPANINHAVNNLAIGEATASWFYHAPRLAFQPVFIWWALIAGGVINWPFRPNQP
ncbi:DoxX family protein [Parasphingorhabdus flavimaris]|uniref:DoxX family protein n=1 Tax=Parasphingorhabdus flavimaris TaxID=266812 RepID=A0ABX2MZZ3_9SPHN|nr:DoxX family protein [Parasphingorhabdus flavimaris]NVD27032.1 DoxX family protein [Parasphingorhabdus flavimaris]|tara:strand:- start:16432 stop:16869 length:438 start_codon:yes stop_codon:yes gene_type:complete